MTEQRTRRMHVTPEWTVQDVPAARMAALADWRTLRAQENLSAAMSMTRHDATEHARETNTRQAAPMADRASLTMPISGVHILPTFGKGEHVAALKGGTQSVTEYATPEKADAWTWLATHTTGDAYMARVLYVMKSEAIQHGRAIDHGKRDDVASVARDLFVSLITGYMAREDVYTIRADSGERTARTLTDTEYAILHDYAHGKSATRCARDYVDALASDAERNLSQWRDANNAMWALSRVRDVLSDLDATDDALGGIVEWGVPRDMRCNACEGCERVRERESARRASRWSVAGCTAPVVTIDWVTPSRALSRAVWRAASDPTLSTSAVYATRAPYLRKLAAEVEQDARMNAQRDGDVLRNVPEGAADLIRLIVATLAITGDAVFTTRGLSPAARTVLTLVMGNSDTEKGERMALAKARKLWTRTGAPSNA